MKKVAIFFLLPFMLPLFSRSAYVTLNAAIEPKYFINEINYTSSANTTINFVELINVQEHSVTEHDFYIALQTDDDEKVTYPLGDYTFIDRGYVLLEFGQALNIPADFTFAAITFDTSFSFEIGLLSDDTNIILDSLVLTNDGLDNDALLISNDTTESFHREKDPASELPYQSGVNKNDYSIAPESPTNSALGVVEFLMAETYDGVSIVRYAPVKNMLMNLTSAQLYYFRNDQSKALIDARQRYSNWAAGRGDHDPYNEGKSLNAGLNAETTALLLILGLAGGSIIIFIFLKKRR